MAVEEPQLTHVRPDAGPPPETAARKALIRSFAILTVLVTAAYLVWRLTGTVNLGVWWVSIPLIAAELHNGIALALYTLSLWEVHGGPKPSPAQTRRKVAVLLPTYNEPEAVLLPAVAAAVALEPAHETWVLDDGRREWVRSLAQELGARYLTRPDNKHAKAGNLNHALEVIDAEIIAVLDADYVASPEFLTRTLGYFDDERVGVVQTPQDFYNQDSFEHEGEVDGAVYNEEAVFYRAIAPAKNFWHAAFWCGTCALIRVEALRSVGGVATETVTEDIHTSFRMMEQGWTAVYHNEVLARGLAPADAHSYMVQRRRWALGAMQVLRADNPLWSRRLSFGQRLAFATTLLGWFDSWRSFTYMVLPVLVLSTGASPIDAPGPVYGPFFVTVLGMQFIALRLLARGYYPPLLSILFEVLRMPAVLPATLRLFWTRGSTTFQVTPKGRTADGRTHAPVPRLLWGIAISSMVALAWFAATTAGLTPGSYPERLAVIGAAFFASVNLAFVAWAIRRIRFARFAGERREGFRFDVTLPGTVDGLPCSIDDLSVTGARATCPSSSGQFAEEVALRVQLPGEHSEQLMCAVRRVRRTEDGHVDLGLEFLPGQRRLAARVALILFNGPDIEPQLQAVEQAA